MSVQRWLRIRDVLRPAICGLCIWAGAAGCDTSHAGTREPAATASATTSSFVARPVQHLLFTAKPTASAAEVEAYYKANLLPAIIKDRRIGEVQVSIDAKGQYIVELELRTATEANLSFAVDVLSVGKTTADGEKILDGFSRYFDVNNAQQLTARGDLSIVRNVMGTAKP